MGLTSTKTSLAKSEYTLTLSSTNHLYRGLSLIQGDFHFHARTKFRIEKEIRIDLIGQLVDLRKSSFRSSRSSAQSTKKKTFFTYSSPLVTSHQNGTARTIKKKQSSYPFRIPLGINLPPSCQFKEFSINYHLNVYHDGRLLPNIHKNVLLAPPTPHVTMPIPCKVTDSNEITLTCALQKSFYSGRDGSVVPLSISLINPEHKRIQSITVQLIQIVSLNGIKQENDIFTSVLSEINEDTLVSPIYCTHELVLPSNLPPTYIPNEHAQPDNVPSIVIIYEFRLEGHMRDATASNLRLSVPVGIE